MHISNSADVCLCMAPSYLGTPKTASHTVSGCNSPKSTAQHITAHHSTTQHITAHHTGAGGTCRILCQLSSCNCAYALRPSVFMRTEETRVDWRRPSSRRRNAWTKPTTKRETQCSAEQGRAGERVHKRTDRHVDMQYPEIGPIGGREGALRMSQVPRYKSDTQRIPLRLLHTPALHLDCQTREARGSGE